MHIAVGITLLHRQTGEHCKITQLTDTHVQLHAEADDETTGCKRADIAEVFEEFGPTYERVVHRDDDTPLTDEVTMQRCPFCASTNLDPTAWARGDGEHGPGCMDCGCTAETVEAWNTRPSRQVGELHVKLSVQGPVGRLEMAGGEMRLTMLDGSDLRNRTFDLYPAVTA